MTIAYEVYDLKQGEPSPYPERIDFWCFLNVMQRPEMQREGLAAGTVRLVKNLDTDRIEVFVTDGGKFMGGMIFTENCEDLHFGTHPGLLGSWMEDHKYSKGLYKAALAYLKTKGHKTMLRTMRVNESTYKTIFKEI